MNGRSPRTSPNSCVSPCQGSSFLAQEPLHPDHRSHGRAAHQIDWRAPSDDEVVEFVECQYAAGKDRRRPWEARAYENLAFAAGEQDLEWSAESLDLAQQTLNREQPKEWYTPLQINTIKGFLVQRIAMIAGQPITWFVPPWTTDDDDVASARIGQKLLQHQWAGGNPGFQTRVLEALWMMFATGVVFARVIWDPKRGGRRSFAPPRGGGNSGGSVKSWLQNLARRLGKTPEDIRLSDEGAYVTAEGDVDVTFPTGFEITEPVRCRSLDEAEWLLYSTLRSIESLREQYGAIADELTADNNSDAFTSGWKAMYGFFDAVSVEPAAHDAPADHVLVHELWRPHSALYPQGFRAVVADERVLKKGAHPYKHGRLPFAALKELPDRRFRPRSTVHMLVEMQRARNDTNGRILTHVAKTTTPGMLIPESAQSKIPDDFLQGGPQITAVPDEAIDGVRPVPTPTLPAAAWQLDARMRDNMMEVAGVHDSSMGRAESAQQSGRHAALLQQSDVRGNSVSRILIEEGLCEIGRQTLWLYYQYATSDRLRIVAGNSYAYEALRFKGSDLYRAQGPPGPTTFNVEVSIGSEPDMASVVAKVDLLIRARVLQPETNEADRLKIQRMLGQAASREFDDAAQQRSNASREHQALLAGEPVDVARGDADAVHLAEHERWTTTGEFRRAQREQRDLQMRLETHIRAHLYQMAIDELRPAFVRAIAQAELLREYGGRAAEVGAKLPGFGRPDAMGSTPPGARGMTMSAGSGASPTDGRIQVGPAATQVGGPDMRMVR